jgi:hypothetical protein
MNKRDNDINIPESDRIAAMLALRLGKLNNQSETPVSDEQLAAFVDGKLQGEGRKAVMAMLVQDEDAYARWVALVEACYDNPVENNVTETKQNGWSFRPWWDKWFGGPLVFVPAMAVAMMAVSVFFYQNDETNTFSDLNLLASKYPVDPDLLSSGVAMRGGALKSLQDYPLWKQQIFTGAKQILGELNQSGIDATNKYTNHPLSGLSENLLNADESLIDLGGWALTTDVLCSAPVSVEAVNALNQVHQQIPVVEFSQYPKELSVLWAAYPQKVTQDTVCAYASSLIAP